MIVLTTPSPQAGKAGAARRTPAEKGLLLEEPTATIHRPVTRHVLCAEPAQISFTNAFLHADFATGCLGAHGTQAAFRSEQGHLGVVRDHAEAAVRRGIAADAAGTEAPKYGVTVDEFHGSTECIACGTG
ncbi:hypothetical protein IMCC9480_3403 [Oxalobacteraceae bacterium IMCC9480]|nr:hypothetical protein IMCC9480_3403 [Oxalobacteraceae bacterium IMCC9480]